jgi:hypothetical protein
MGNYDWGNRAAGYLPYWRRYGRARPWYGFELAGWEPLSLNSQEPHEPGSPQLRWLERVLVERAPPAGSSSGTGRVSAPEQCTGTPPTSRRSGAHGADAHGWSSKATSTH